MCVCVPCRRIKKSWLKFAITCRICVCLRVCVLHQLLVFNTQQSAAVESLHVNDKYLHFHAADLRVVWFFCWGRVWLLDKLSMKRLVEMHLWKQGISIIKSWFLLIRSIKLNIFTAQYNRAYTELDVKFDSANPHALTQIFGQVRTTSTQSGIDKIAHHRFALVSAMHVFICKHKRPTKPPHCERVCDHETGALFDVCRVWYAHSRMDPQYFDMGHHNTPSVSSIHGPKSGADRFRSILYTIYGLIHLFRSRCVWNCASSATPQFSPKQIKRAFKTRLAIASDLR